MKMKMEEVERPENWATMTREQRNEWNYRYSVYECGLPGCGCVGTTFGDQWAIGQPWQVYHRHRVACTFREMVRENEAGEWRKHSWGERITDECTLQDILRESNTVPCPDGIGIDFKEERAGDYRFLMLYFKRR